MNHLLETLQSWPPEVIWVILLISAYGCLITCFRLFGKAGAQVYSVVALICANLQVLKASEFFYSSSPVALGTILFSTTFLATDILAETHGRKAAMQTVWLGFAAMIMLTLFMVLALGFRPVSPESQGWEWAWENHTHLTAIFTPVPAILLAGMIAYLTSQTLDVLLFEKFREITKGKSLWLRNNLSTAVSSLIDNTVFSILAWRILAPHPLDWKVVVFTYILGTYALRLFVALVDTPFLYWAVKNHAQRKNKDPRD